MGRCPFLFLCIKIHDRMGQVERLVAGTMTWGQWGRGWSTRDMAKYIEALHAAGVTKYDHADIYGGYTTEAEWGAAWDAVSIDREEVQITTKCGIRLPSDIRPEIKFKSYLHTYDYMVDSARQSIRALQCGYIDQLLIHRPGPLMQYGEMARAASDLVAEGLIRSFGVSNFLPHQVDALRQHVPVSVNQIELSVAHLAPFVDGQLDYCMQHGIKVMAWSPLGGGKLRENVDLLSRLEPIAQRLDTTIETLAYVLLLHHPASIQLVLGTTRMERVSEAIAALSFSVSDELWYEIYTACLGRDVA